jgi:sigma-E factor negative regulatory protein RseA
MMMKTDTQAIEALSGMLDGDITDAQLDVLLAKLDQADASIRKDWALYHQIGDVLRSDDLAMPMSADFTTRLGQRLAAEPVVLAPRALRSGNDKSNLQGDAQYAPMLKKEGRTVSNAWRIVGSVGGLAAALLLGVSIAPQLTAIFKDPGAASTSASIAQNQLPQNKVNVIRPENESGVQLVSNQEFSDIRATEKEDAAQGAPIQIIRDPNLDSYLQAHQKFSPSIGNSSRYVRRANTPVAASAAAGNAQ